MTRVVDEPCVVLHTRPYRENSMIVSLFCPGHGKVGAVARGVRGNRRGRILQPFANLQVSWVGKSSLVTLTGFEVAKQVWLKADRLAAGFYVTELVSRLVGERESLPRLYAAVVWAFDSLGESSLDMEFILRSFEKLLLEELGYGLDFSRDAVSGQAVIADQYYSMDPAVGFQQSSQGLYSGSALLGIHAESFSDRSVKRAAKRIFRQALAVLLGPKPLMSRRLLLGSRR
ncbi:MAG: DNA repair protein RecO [Pseudomonadales bacterium]